MSDAPRRNTRRYGPVEVHILDTIALIDPTKASMRMAEFTELCLDGMPAVGSGERDTRRPRLVRAFRNMTKGPDAVFGVQHGNIIFYK